MRSRLRFPPSRPLDVIGGARRTAALLAALLGCCVPLLLVSPLSAAELPTRAEARQVNDETVGIVFHYEDVYRRLIADMSDEFGASGVRVKPIIGRNHVQTVYDMLYMQGVDLGIVHSDVFEYMARVQGEQNLRRRISNLAEIWTEKVAIVAGEGVETLDALAGESVNFGKLGKGSDITATLLFDTLGIAVEPTRFDKLEALEKVKSGEISAMVYLIEEPIEAFTSLSPEDGVRLLELPAEEELLAHYGSSKLEPEDFPALVSEGSAVPTLAVSVIIAAYEWSERDAWRYEKSRRFTEAFVANLATLKENDESGLWTDVSIEKEAPGVTRLSLVEEIVGEQERLEREREQAAREAELAELRARQQELIARLTDSLDGEVADPTELEELEKLVEQFRQSVD